MVTKYNWKKGDEIICINNQGKSYDLTVGKKYIVAKCYKESGVYQVDLLGDEIYVSVFCSRFNTLREERNKKLQKIKSSI